MYICVKKIHTTMRIIHISDFHLDKKTAADSAFIADKLAETL